jgi:hypothetical protein
VSEKKRKKFNYKVARFRSDGKRSLQISLQNALGKLLPARDRLQEFQFGGEKQYRLINEFSDQGKLLCGVMMSYTAGLHQNVVTLDALAHSFKLDQIAPMLDDPELQSEFVEGLLYFGIYKNHIIFVGSPHLHSKQLEDHLNWFLRDRTKVLPKGEGVLVADPVKPDYSDRLFKGLKELRLKAPLEFRETTSQVDQEQEAVSRTRFRPSGGQWDAIVGFVRGIGGELPDINFPGGLVPENLEVSLIVRSKGRRKSKANQVTPVLDPVANGLRHIEDAPLELLFLDGTAIRGSDFKVSQNFTVQSVNGVPLTGEVYKAMRYWLEQLIAKGEIEPE